MSEGWKADKQWSDRFLPQIKRELGAFLIMEPTVDEDQMRNTDLIVLKMDSVRIACRIRKFSFYEQRQYRNEFTIRSGRPSGNDTELTKIIAGWGDFLFYGFSDADERELVAWRIISLTDFRLWFTRSIVANKGAMPGTEKKNHDGSSSFIAFDTATLPTACVALQSGFDMPESATVAAVQNYEKNTMNTPPCVEVEFEW